MDKLAEQFAALAQKYGPTVVNAAEQAARVEGYSTLVSGFFMVVLAVFLSISGAFMLKWARTKDETENSFALLAYPVSVAMIGTSAAFVFFGVWTAIDPWTWTAIAHPDLYLAKRAFGL